EHVNLVAHTAHRRIARADCQECMPAANDRLVCVVCIEMKSAPGEKPGENIARGSDALAVLTADGDCEIYFIHGAFPGRMKGWVRYRDPRTAICIFATWKVRPGFSRR